MSQSAEKSQKRTGSLGVLTFFMFYNTELSCPTCNQTTTVHFLFIKEANRKWITVDARLLSP